MIPVENARPSSFVQVRGAPPPKRTDRLFAPRILIARDCLRKTRDAPSEQHDPLGFSHSHSPPYFAATLRLPPLALDFRQSELHRRTYPSLRPASPSGLFPWMRDVHILSVSLGHFRRAPQLRPPQLRGLARSERPFASAPPDGGEADSCRERPSRRLSERDSGSASALVGEIGTDRSQRREERTNETMLKCPNGRGLPPRVRRYHCDTLSGRAINRQVRGQPVWRNAIATGLVARRMPPTSLPEGAIAAGFPPSAGAPSPAGPPPPPPSARRRRWAPRRG